MFKLSSFGSWGLQEVPGEQRGEALSKIGTVTEDRKGHSNSQRGTSEDRRDQGEPVTCTAEFTIRKKQLSHHGECGKVIGKKKRSSLRLPAAEGQVSDPYLTLYSNKFVWGRGVREMNGDTEKKKNYSRGKRVVKGPWRGLENTGNRFFRFFTYQGAPPQVQGA